MDSGKRSALFRKEYRAWSPAVSALGKSLEAGRAKILQRPRCFRTVPFARQKFLRLVHEELEPSCYGLLPRADLGFE